MGGTLEESNEKGIDVTSLVTTVSGIDPKRLVGYRLKSKYGRDLSYLRIFSDKIHYLGDVLEFKSSHHGADKYQLVSECFPYRGDEQYPKLTREFVHAYFSGSEQLENKISEGVIKDALGRIAYGSNLTLISIVEDEIQQKDNYGRRYSLQVQKTNEIFDEAVSKMEEIKKEWETTLDRLGRMEIEHGFPKQLSLQLQEPTGNLGNAERSKDVVGVLEKYREIKLGLAQFENTPFFTEDELIKVASELKTYKSAFERSIRQNLLNFFRRI